MVLAHYGVTGLNDTNALALLTAIGAGGVFCAVFYSFTTRRLLARLERLQQCVEHASDAMLWVRVTKDGQFFYEGMNQSWQRLSGPPGRDCIGSTPHDVWPKAVADAMVMQLRTIVTTGRAGHYTWPKPGTTDHQISVVITPVRDGNSRRVATLLCQAREVGAREVVAREVGAREAGTVVVQHDHRADIVRRLAAGVAHDFNNVLQAVCSGLELILDEVPSPDPSRELALVALVAARRGNQLTDSLLSYARRQVLTPGPINLREWLPQIAPALEEALGPANQLVLIFAGAPAVVLADETALRAALINLALNAGRAMADGGLLRIETEAGQDPDHFAPSVRIKLFDNGAGMDEVTLARCPEPFFTTLGLTATGLGLSMVQGFAAQSGGSLQLSSRLGEGTTAVLTLPAYLGDIPHGHYPLRDAGESQQGAAAHDLESAIAEI
jgi:signal transduction histidine kinase